MIILGNFDVSGGETYDHAQSEPYAPFPVDAVEVKKEAARRIGERYPVWRQLNLIREGGEALAEMGAAIDAIRDASNAIEAMEPIPHDFATDARWPSCANKSPSSA